MSEKTGRREFVKQVALGGLGLTALGCSKGVLGKVLTPGILKRPRPKNVLLITADDMNYDTPGCAGCKVPDITPNIDRLASEGIRFVHGHVTAAVCQPCRSVLMTGRYPYHNGARGFEPIFEDTPTLQESLRSAGYLNGIMAKVSHLTPQKKFCWDSVIEADELGSGRSPELYYQKSLEFFAQAKAAGKPFCLMANSQDPHRPFSGSPGEEQESKKAKKLFKEVSRRYKPEEIEVPGFLPDLPGVREEMAQYFTSSHRCDETVGAVLKALKESGLEDNTIVMFLSDNGISEPFAKTNCYLSSTRTPWIVRWPGQVRNSVVDQNNMISGIDFMPTVLDALGLPNPEGMDGRSFLPLLRGEKQPDRNWVYTVFEKRSGNTGRLDFPMRCYQDQRFGYIYNDWSDGETVFQNESMGGLAFKAMTKAAETDPALATRIEFYLHRVPEEFYDFQDDPCALKNLINVPACQDNIKKFRGAAYRTMKSTSDPLTERFAKRILRA